MNVPSDPLQRSRTFHFLQREALVVKQRFVGVKQGAVFVQDKKMLRKEIYQLPKLLFVLTELCLSALQVIDVSVRSIPVDNVARFVAQRLSPKQEPSIHSGWPDARNPSHLSVISFKSSGWMASRHPQPELLRA
jgi:hypothetical protein